jgi:hypothetical protein
MMKNIFVPPIWRNKRYHRFRIFDLMKHEIEKSFARQKVPRNSLLGCMLSENGLNESPGLLKIENRPLGVTVFFRYRAARDRPKKKSVVILAICGKNGFG